MEEGLKYLNDLMWSYRASRTLQTGCMLKIFTHLAHSPMTARELSEQCKAPADKLDKLLIACCSIGLLDKKQSKYSNTQMADAYLVEGRPLYQGNIILHAMRVWDVWSDLPAKLTANPDRAAGSEQENFIMGMHNLTMAGRGDMFLNAVDLTGRKNMLDVGGGPGTYSIFACRKYPQLHATVFDVPETIAIARRVVESENMLDRIAFREADWDTDDFGSGFDVVLMSNVLHGPESNAPAKLAKASRCMQSGGLLVVQEFMLNDEKTGPAVPALFNIMVGAYSRRELFEVIKRAGFSDIRVIAQNDAIGNAWITAIKK